MGDPAHTQDNDLGRQCRAAIVRTPGLFRVLAQTEEGRRELRKHRAIAHRMVIATESVEMATFAGWMLHEIARALRQQRRRDRAGGGHDGG
jgi:hypothetical protein